MRMQKNQVLIGARIPLGLKEQLLKFCLGHGIKMNYFVAEAIKEKLLETIEDYQDVSVSKKRLKNAQFVSQRELDKYLSKKKKQSK